MFPQQTAAPRQPFDWQVSTLAANDVEGGRGDNNNNNRACCCPSGTAAFCSTRLLAPPGTTPVHALCPLSCSAQEATRWLMKTPNRRTAGRAAYPAFSPGCTVLRPALCSSGSRTPSGEAFRLCARLHAGGEQRGFHAFLFLPNLFVCLFVFLFVCLLYIGSLCNLHVFHVFICTWRQRFIMYRFMHYNNAIRLH